MRRLIDFLERRRLPAAKEVFLGAVFLFLWLYFFFTVWVATRAELKFLGEKNLDKIPHLLGGMLIAGGYEFLAYPRKLASLLALFFFLALGWEAFEALFIPEVIYFRAVSPDLWRLDTLGDLMAGLLGAYGYWVFVTDRR